MRNDSFSAGLWVFAQSVEKFGGYTQSLSVRDQIAAAASVPGMSGLELIAPITCDGRKCKGSQGLAGGI